MFSANLISLLSALSKSELNKLRKFIHSPYFNEQKDAQELYDILIETQKKGNSLQNITKEALWNVLFPTKKDFSDIELRRLTSALSNLILQFISFEAYGQNTTLQQLDIYKRLNLHMLHKQMAQIERKVESTLASELLIKPDDYLHHFQWQMYQMDLRPASASYATQLIDARESLEIYYYINNIKLLLAETALTNALQTTKHKESKSQVPFVPLTNPELLKKPIVQTYRKALQCNSDDDNDDNYFSFKETLFQYENELSTDDLFDLYQILLNYCAGKINKGYTNFYQESFSLHEKMTDNGLLVHKGVLGEAQFKNIITVGLNRKQIQWVEDFIKNYAAYLPEPVRENAQSYNLANVYFSLKNYGDALTYLQDTEYTNNMYILGSKWLLARTYYETQNISSLESLINSFSIYLKRNKDITNQTKQEYLNVLSFTKKMMKLNKKDIKSIKALKEQVQATKNLPKAWLLEKITELENG